MNWIQRLCTEVLNMIALSSKFEAKVFHLNSWVPFPLLIVSALLMKR